MTFSYDMEKAEQLAEAWRKVGVPVKMGGPVFNEPGGSFVPGMYLKKGYVITSRGCPNRCDFCAVPMREGYTLRELPVTYGWNVLDDNILACSTEHIKKVFAMLKRQPEKPIFTGGLEARFEDFFEMPIEYQLVYIASELYELEKPVWRDSFV